MSVNPIAQELNAAIKRGNPHLMEMLSKVGRRLFFPKGIPGPERRGQGKGRSAFSTRPSASPPSTSIPWFCPRSWNISTAVEIEPRESLTYAPSFGLPELRQMLERGHLRKKSVPCRENRQFARCHQRHYQRHQHFCRHVSRPGRRRGSFPIRCGGTTISSWRSGRDAVICNYPMFADGGGFNLKGFEDRVRMEAENNYKVIVFLNFPNNPTGLYQSMKAEGGSYC